jgi:hypothetical protein
MAAARFCDTHRLFGDCRGAIQPLEIVTMAE